MMISTGIHAIYTPNRSFSLCASPSVNGILKCPTTSHTRCFAYKIACLTLPTQNVTQGEAILCKWLFASSVDEEIVNILPWRCSCLFAFKAIVKTVEHTEKFSVIHSSIFQVTCLHGEPYQRGNQWIISEIQTGQPAEAYEQVAAPWGLRKRKDGL